MRTGFTLVLLLLVAIVPANAEVLDRTAETGKPSRIRSYFAWNPDCSFKSVAVNVISAPAHGTLQPRFADHVLGATATKLLGGGLGNCAGRTVRALELHYTSKDGFTGADKFSLDLIVNGKKIAVDTYNVTVK
jgi:hypothetical protein